MGKPQFTVTKSIVECYKMRSKEFAWADITIDAQGNTGRIQIASDYGSWQNFWGSCGMPFKEFLHKLNLDYTAVKFGASNWFDLEKTLKFQKESIISNTESEERKELLSELKQLKSASCKEEYISIMQSCDKIMSFENYTPELCNSVEPGFKRFWNEIWPVFLKELE